MKRRITARALGLIVFLVLLTALPGLFVQASAPAIPLLQGNPYIVVAQGSSGSPDFDTLDPDGLNALVRTNDSMTYNVQVNRRGSPDEPLLITIDLSDQFVLPANYALSPGDPYYANQVEKYDYNSILPVAGGCLNPSTATPPPAGSSGVSADGQTLYCLAPSGQTVELHFSSRILPTTPNGTIIPPPTFTASDGKGFIYETDLQNVTDITVVAKPTWDVRKETNWKGAVMIPASGPNGEDGYIMTYQVGVYVHRSIKGIEMLQSPIVLTDDYADADLPNARLVTWPINNFWLKPNNAAYELSLPANQYCYGVRDAYGMTGNRLDNTYFYVKDIQSGAYLPSEAAWSVPNGGDCAITAFDDTAKTFTMEITGADLTFTHYPTKRGSGGTTPLVNKAYPDDPSNQYWVANKFFLLWAPKTDIPLRSEPVTVDFTNTIGYNQLRGLSITGVPNYDPDPYEDAATYQVTRVARVTFNKMNSNMRYTNPNGWNYAYTDPNASGDAIVNQVVPNQYFNAYIRVTNTGSETIENGVVCEKIDNTRTTFVDMTATAFRATQGLKDPDTGTIDFFISGNYSFMQGYNVQIGVPLNGLTWSSMNNVTNEYMAPLTSGSAMSNASCGDSDAIWFDSVAALRGAGYALQDVNRVRITFTSMTPGVNLLFFVPLKALPYMAAGSTDVPGTAYFEGDTTVGTYSPNQAYISGSNLSLTKSSDAIKIIGDEWAMLTKTSPSHPENISVGIDTQITYALQVNLTTNADPHDTTIFVWDVLPPYTTYVGGSTQFGGVNIEPVCGTALDPLPADVFPNGVPTGYTPCRWTIPGLAVTRAPAGSTSGNAPLLTFRALVTAGAANGSPLYNTAFVDSLTNEVNLPVYMGGSQGFRCAAGEFCSRDDHVVVFDSAMKYTYQKFAKTTLVKPGEDLPYSLVYGVNDTGVTDLRILDVFPYTADTDPNRKSVFSGTLGLSSWLQPPAANMASVPPLTEDASIVYYYTNALPGNINRNPYDPSNSLNSGGSTPWCTEAQILAAASGCTTMTPANVTAFMAVRTSNVPLVPGTLYQIDLTLKPTGNVNSNYYTNSYSFAISGTPAYSTSNAARISVAGVSPTMTKIVDRTTASSNEELVFTLLPRNNYVNSGAAPLPAGTTFVIKDPLPPTLVLESVSTGSDWNCNSGSDWIECTFTSSSSIPSGAAIGSPIVIHTRVESGAGAQSGLFNMACLEVYGSVAASLCAQANFRIIAVPRLELDKLVTSQGLTRWAIPSPISLLLKTLAPRRLITLPFRIRSCPTSHALQLSPLSSSPAAA